MTEKVDKKSFQWQPVIELIIVMATVLGSTIPLYIHTDNKLEATLKDIRNDMKEFRQEMKEIKNEMKDCHGRLCIIEERIQR